MKLVSMILMWIFFKLTCAVHVDVAQSTGSPLLMKILHSVDTATSNEHLFHVTLNLLKSLCLCMRETLTQKENKFNEETNYLHNDSDGKDLEIYRKIYNNTCFNLREELTYKLNKTYDSTLENDNSFDRSNCFRHGDVTGRSIKEDNNLKVQNKTNMEKIIYKIFFATRKNHNYTIKNYNLFGKAKPHNKLNSQHSIIVILTLLPKNNSSFNDKIEISEKELNDTIYSDLLVDIDVIDAKYDPKSRESEENLKINKVLECHLMSLYTFLIESEKKNLTKSFKLLRKYGTIKIYVDIITSSNHLNYINICCTNNTLAECKDYFLKKKINSEADNLKINKKVGNYKDTILKIKHLVQLYDKKLKNDLSLIDGNINETNVNKDDTECIGSPYSNITHAKFNDGGEDYLHNTVSKERKTDTKKDLFNFFQHFHPFRNKLLSIATKDIINKQETKLKTDTLVNTQPRTEKSFSALNFSRLFLNDKNIQIKAVHKSNGNFNSSIKNNLLDQIKFNGSMKKYQQVKGNSHMPTITNIYKNSDEASKINDTEWNKNILNYQANVFSNISATKKKSTSFEITRTESFIINKNSSSDLSSTNKSFSRASTPTTTDTIISYQNVYTTNSLERQLSSILRINKHTNETVFHRENLLSDKISYLSNAIISTTPVNNENLSFNIFSHNKSNKQKHTVSSKNIKDKASNAKSAMLFSTTEVNLNSYNEGLKFTKSIDEYSTKLNTKDIFLNVIKNHNDNDEPEVHFTHIPVIFNYSDESNNDGYSKTTDIVIKTIFPTETAIEKPLAIPWQKESSAILNNRIIATTVNPKMSSQIIVTLENEIKSPKSYAYFEKRDISTFTTELIVEDPPSTSHLHSSGYNLTTINTIKQSTTWPKIYENRTMPLKNNLNVNFSTKIPSNNKEKYFDNLNSTSFRNNTPNTIFIRKGIDIGAVTKTDHNKEIVTNLSNIENMAVNKDTNIKINHFSPYNHNSKSNKTIIDIKGHFEKITLSNNYKFNKGLETPVNVNIMTVTTDSVNNIQFNMENSFETLKLPVNSSDKYLNRKTSPLNLNGTINYHKEEKIRLHFSASKDKTKQTNSFEKQITSGIHNLPINPSIKNISQHNEGDEHISLDSITSKIMNSTISLQESVLFPSLITTKISIEIENTTKSSNNKGTFNKTSQTFNKTTIKPPTIKPSSNMIFSEFSKISNLTTKPILSTTYAQSLNNKNRYIFITQVDQNTPKSLHPILNNMVSTPDMFLTQSKAIFTKSQKNTKPLLLKSIKSANDNLSTTSYTTYGLINQYLNYSAGISKTSQNYQVVDPKIQDSETKYAEKQSNYVTRKILISNKSKASPKVKTRDFPLPLNVNNETHEENDKTVLNLKENILENFRRIYFPSFNSLTDNTRIPSNIFVKTVNAMRDSERNNKTTLLDPDVNEYFRNISKTTKKVELNKNNYTIISTSNEKAQLFTENLNNGKSTTPMTSAHEIQTLKPTSTKMIRKLFHNTTDSRERDSYNIYLQKNDQKSNKASLLKKDLNKNLSEGYIDNKENISGSNLKKHVNNYEEPKLHSKEKKPSEILVINDNVFPNIYNLSTRTDTSEVVESNTYKDINIETLINDHILKSSTLLTTVYNNNIIPSNNISQPTNAPFVRDVQKEKQNNSSVLKVSRTNHFKQNKMSSEAFQNYSLSGILVELSHSATEIPNSIILVDNVNTFMESTTKSPIYISNEGTDSTVDGNIIDYDKKTSHFSTTITENTIRSTDLNLNTMSTYIDEAKPSEHIHKHWNKNKKYNKVSKLKPSNANSIHPKETKQHMSVYLPLEKIVVNTQESFIINPKNDNVITQNITEALHKTTSRINLKENLLILPEEATTVTLNYSEKVDVMPENVTVPSLTPVQTGSSNKINSDQYLPNEAEIINTPTEKSEKLFSRRMQKDIDLTQSIKFNKVSTEAIFLIHNTVETKKVNNEINLRNNASKFTNSNYSFENNFLYNNPKRNELLNVSSNVIIKNKSTITVSPLMENKGVFTTLSLQSNTFNNTDIFDTKSNTISIQDPELITQDGVTKTEKENSTQANIVDDDKESKNLIDLFSLNLKTQTENYHGDTTNIFFSNATEPDTKNEIPQKEVTDHINLITTEESNGKEKKLIKFLINRQLINATVMNLIILNESTNSTKILSASTEPVLISTLNLKEIYTANNSLTTVGLQEINTMSLNSSKHYREKSINESLNFVEMPNVSSLTYPTNIFKTDFETTTTRYIYPENLFYAITTELVKYKNKATEIVHNKANNNNSVYDRQTGIDDHKHLKILKPLINSKNIEINRDSYDNGSLIKKFDENSSNSSKILKNFDVKNKSSNTNLETVRQRIIGFSSTAPILVTKRKEDETSIHITKEKHLNNTHTLDYFTNMNEQVTHKLIVNENNRLTTTKINEYYEYNNFLAKNSNITKFISVEKFIHKVKNINLAIANEKSLRRTIKPDLNCISINKFGINSMNHSNFLTKINLQDLPVFPLSNVKDKSRRWNGTFKNVVIKPKKLKVSKEKIKPNIQNQTNQNFDNKNITTPSTMKTTKTIKYNTYEPTHDFDVSFNHQTIFQRNLAKYNKSNHREKDFRSHENIAVTHHNNNKHSDITFKTKTSTSSNIIKFHNQIKKTNLYPLQLVPVKTQKKVMTRIKLSNKKTLSSNDLFSQKRFMTQNNFIQAFPSSLQRPAFIHNTPKYVIVRPKHKFNKSKEHFRAKPLLIKNENDKSFYRKEYKKNYGYTDLSRNKFGFAQDALPKTFEPNYESSADRPITVKPKFLRDRIDSIRNYVLNSDFLKATKRPPVYKDYFLKPQTEEESESNPSVFDYRRNYLDKETTFRPPQRTPRRRRTMFFLSPTVPYNRYF